MQKKPIQLGKGMAALLGNNPSGSYTDGPIEPTSAPAAKKEIQIEVIHGL